MTRKTNNGTPETTLTATERLAQLQAEIASLEAQAAEEQIAKRLSLIEEITETMQGFTARMIEVGTLHLTLDVDAEGHLLVDVPAHKPHKPTNGNHGKVNLEIGTVILRTYKGQDYHLQVTGEGLVEGLVVRKVPSGEMVGTYKSLSGAAQGITGSKALNGRAWWGIKD
jgi:hypothetical protein